MDTEVNIRWTGHGELADLWKRLQDSYKAKNWRRLLSLMLLDISLARGLIDKQKYEELRGVL